MPWVFILCYRRAVIVTSTSLSSLDTSLLNSTDVDCVVATWLTVFARASKSYFWALSVYWWRSSVSLWTLSAIPFLSLAISWHILGGPFQARQGTCHQKCLVWQAWNLLLIWVFILCYRRAVIVTSTSLSSLDTSLLNSTDVDCVVATWLTVFARASKSYFWALSVYWWRSSVSLWTLSAIPFLSLAISWHILGGPFQARQGTCHQKCLVWQAWDLLLIWSRWDVFHHQAARQVRWTTSCKTAWSYRCHFGSWKRVSGCGLICYSWSSPSTLWPWI